MSNKIQKSISILTSITTTIMVSGVVMLAPLAVSAVTIVDGDIVSPDAAFTQGGITYYPYDVFIVKILSGKTFKRLILNPQVFDSYGHLKWSNIKTISASTVEGYTTSQLVREINDTKVYKLVPDGDTGTKEWMNMTAAEFGASYDWDSIYIINATDRDNYTTGSDTTDSTDTTVSTGTLTAVLAADTPAAGITVKSAARLSFTKINLTATGGDVIVDSLVVKRTGLAQDGAFSGIDLIDASTNRAINNTSKTFNSLHEANFTDDFTVSKGTTKSIILAGNMAADLTSYSAEAPSLSLSSVTLKGDATLSASLPLTGNPMTNNNTIAIGSATIQIGAYTNATSTTIQVGKTDYTFFSFQVQGGTTEKVQFSQIRVYQEGSASLGTDVINLKLLQDGTKIADGVVHSSKYVDFSFGTITIDKGQIAQFQVKADVNDGSARTIKLGIYKTTDLLVKGVTYGYYITPTYSGAGFSSSLSPVLHDNQFTISNGTVQVTKSSTVGAENIAVSSDQILGAYEFEVKGEPITVSSLVLTVTSTGDPGAGSDAVLGVELVDPSGSVVAGPTDPVRSTGVVTWSDSFTLPVGKTVYKVRGDLQTSASWASNDTIYVSFTPSAMTATGDTTGNSITATPSSALSANTQTVKAATLTVTRNTLPATGNIIVNQSNVTLSSWNFDATDSGEDIRVTSVLWAGKGQSATNTDALVTYVDENKNGKWDEGTDTALSPINDGLSSTNASSTFAFTDPIIITKGTSKHIALKGNKDSVSSNDSEQWGLGDGTASVIVYGVNTGNSVAEALTHDHGPTLTSNVKGTLTIETSNNPASAIVVAGSTGNVFTNVKLTAKYEDLNLDQLVVFVGDGSYEFSGLTGNYQDVTNVAIYNGTTKIGNAAIPSTGYYTFNFDKGAVIIPEGTLNAKTLVVKVDMSTVDPDTDNAPGTNSADLKIGFGGTDGVKTTGKASNSEITGSSYETYRSSSSSAMVLRTSKPTVTLPTSSNSLGAATTLGNGNVPVYAFKVTADAAGGDVLLYRTTFVFATSGSGMTITDVRIDDQDGNTIKAAANPVSYSIDNNYEYYYTATFNNPDFTVDDTDEAIKVPAGESRTFKVYATMAGVSTGETLSTFLAGDFASTSTAVNSDNSAKSFKAPVGDLTTDRSNFVWSDNYKALNISGTAGNNATTAAQWYNGHLISGLGNKVSSTPYSIGN